MVLKNVVNDSELCSVFSESHEVVGMTKEVKRLKKRIQRNTAEHGIVKDAV